LRIKVTILLSFLLLDLYAQTKQDYHWLFSNNTELTPGNESYGFDFNVGEDVGSFQGLLPIRFQGLNASISDEHGNLIFYSNGCQIVGADHKVLPNGSNLNKGDWFEMIGDSCNAGYIGFQDILILPDPANDEGFYHVNKIIIHEDELRYRKLRYSYIDKSLNNGIGDVTEKNINVSFDNQLLYNYLTAIKHKNGEDWWIMQPAKSPSGFHVYKIDEYGFLFDKFIPSEIPFHEFSSAAGTAVFSPDGSKYAYYNMFDNLNLYSFDREEATLTDRSYLEINKDTIFNAQFSSVEFSPNGRYLYVAVRDSLWQVDTFEESLEDGLELIDVYDGTSDPFPTVFHLMALAPDCKIYITPSSSSNVYHVINKPNEKGVACDFAQRGIHLPFTSSAANLPNFPKFRVDEDEKCDPTIGTMFGEVVYYRRDLSLFPNPSKGKVTIEIPEGFNGRLYVFDMHGREVIQNMEINNRNEKQLDLSNLSSGSYTIEFIPLDTSEKLIWTNKIVIVK